MAQYIDKAALIAEIERRKKQHEEWKNSCKGIDSLLAASMLIQEDINILSLINSLEVREVDLEKEIELVEDKYYGFESSSRADIIEIIKHFFELGMAVSNKSQKGENV